MSGEHAWSDVVFWAIAAGVKAALHLSRKAVGRMTKMQMTAVRAAMVAMLGSAMVACAAPSEEDAMSSTSKVGNELRVLEASGGAVVGELSIDGEVLRVTDRIAASRRELIVERAGAELARWSFDPKTLDIHGAFDGHGFGTHADRATDNDRAHWDAVRQSRAAQLLRALAAAARAMATRSAHGHDVEEALLDVARIDEVLGNLGRWSELNEEASEGEPEPTSGGERLTCSNTSAVGHYIRYVQTFTSNCRIGHRAYTNKPSGSCVHNRCVQYVYDDGNSASGVYCNSYGITLDIDHVVPRGGGTHGLWSKHWSAAGMLHWERDAATCY